MSALITYEWTNVKETYRAKVETQSDAVRVIADATGDFWLRISNKTSLSALMTRDEAAALRDMLTEALEAQGVRA